ncbi:radical SAM protein [Candidatus Bathyarchaeota archaeon]|nr:radical SAM protein [Candidatus Bathyarchaeota archaeon]
MAKKGPLLMTSWRATGKCNCNCLYCNVNSTSKPAIEELNTEEALKLVDEAYNFGIKWFGIKGGEPLLRKDIFEIITYAKSLDLNVCLLTNGYFIDGEIYDKLVENQVWTSISIDGPEEINDKLRGKGYYKKAFAAIQKLSKAKILNGLATAITSVNYKHLDHIAELADEYGANFVWYNALVPSGRAKETLELAPTPAQYEWALSHIWDLTKKYEDKFDIHVHCPHFARVVKQRDPENFEEWYSKKFHGKCTYFAFGGYISVTENGSLIPCFYTDLQPQKAQMLGNIREKSLSQTWAEIQKSDYYRSFLDRSNLKGKCGVCEYNEICGGCRNRSYAYTNDLFESDPACAYIPKSLRKQTR